MRPSETVCYPRCVTQERGWPGWRWSLGVVTELSNDSAGPSSISNLQWNSSGKDPGALLGHAQ